MSQSFDKMSAARALRQVKKIVHYYRDFKPGFILSYPGDDNYIRFYWKIITLELSYMFTQEALLLGVLSFPSSRWLSGNGTPDATPLRRELNSLSCVDSTENCTR